MNENAPKVKVMNIEINRILNPTGIDLGEFVVNPYRGCAYGCLYCYVRHNKNTLKDKRPWGDYVDVRINALELLEKEIGIKKPGTILLGSTTECFQPVEANYQITGKILDILNSNQIYYNILTRSPLILEYIQALKLGYCKNVYFTVNNYDDDFKSLLEPFSPDFNERILAVSELLAEGIDVIPYFSPILPDISVLEGVFEKFPLAKRIDFECLNFNLGNIAAIIEAIASLSADRGSFYSEIAASKIKHDEVWRDIKSKILRMSVSAGKQHHVHIHEFNGYFENKYQDK